ncbi:Syntaxin-6 [Coemansia sp. RSA 988]|nr:Syntaxin-6 [Coemansia sp. RSA 988]
MSDPFVVVQEDVVSTFEQARTLLASWRMLHQKTRSPQEENEYQFVTDELYSTLTSVESDLTDLQEAVDAARETPAEYGLSGSQITERQNFVASKRQAVEDMRHILTQPDAKKGSHRIGLRDTRSDRGNSAHDYHRHHSGSREHNVEVENYQEQHQVLMDQQDQQFDSMLDTVRNLHGIASTMNTELEDQAIMLDDVGSLMERTQSKLSSARKKVDKFLRDKNNRSIYIALVLFLIILVLLLLVIFT